MVVLKRLSRLSKQVPVMPQYYGVERRTRCPGLPQTPPASEGCGEAGEALPNVADKEWKSPMGKAM